MTAVQDVALGWTLPATLVAIEFSDHAVEQANRRVFRHLDLEFAAYRAHWLLPDATVSLKRPEWLRSGAAVAWLVSEDPRIAFALKPKGEDAEVLVATTAFAADEHDDPVGATVRWRTEK